MKKTALGQLKENVKESQLLKVTTKFLIMAFIDELKEKETQDLIDACQTGINKSLDYSFEPQDYYNKTFKQ